MLCWLKTPVARETSIFTQPQHSCFLLFITLLGFSSFGSPVKISPPPNSQNLSVSIPPWAQGRFFAVSDTEPFARHLQYDREYLNALGVITDFYLSVEGQVNHSRRSAGSMSDAGRACNAKPKSWHAATQNVALNRGWPVSESNGSICITNFYGVPLSFPLSVERIREVFEVGVKAVNRNSYRVMLETVGNWTYAKGGLSLEVEFASQICELKNYGGFRLHRKWYHAVGATNEPGNRHLPDGKRKWLHEVHRIENGAVVAAAMTLPINPGKGVFHNVTDRATTMMATWGGAVNPASQFEPSTVYDNLALAAAQEKGSRYAQQMEDVILGSNTAILALPLVLNLIPVSLITICEKWTMVIYVLLSDILTALPMLIKGIELLNIGNSNFTEIVTRIGDTHEEETIAIETWVATCRVQHDAKTIGIVFITTASVAMFVGVLLELIAYSLLSRARRKKREEIDEMQYLEEYEQHAWKYYDKVNQSRGMMQDYGFREVGRSRPIHDTWTPMPAWHSP
ncbi:unnamed protein product [Agarophyton chilense]|eukprot:gb/GEZJ01006694.1/.p1 GENE.gb/GEZJ01006694.1/~~gb/GEZJ01006694.1/.p1  ORF type:complete len:512 (-),score=51.52 gb/GEZJ01006694.1/:435-1970(-)